MKRHHRRDFLRLAAGAGALAATSPVARAQSYPTRPLATIVPFAAGGGTDVAARVVAEHMSRTLRQQVVVENVAGAGGTTRSIRAMRANADGYTILMGHMGTHAVAPSRTSHTSRILILSRSAWSSSPLDGRSTERLATKRPARICRLRKGKFRQDEHGTCRNRIERIQFWFGP